jgi:hypothetical protein
MIRPFFYLICLTLFISQLAMAAPERPFKRVMLFPGGGLQNALFLGMLEAAEESGQRPDLIIGTCGGSIAAALATHFPDSKSRREFVESRTYYELLTKVRLENADLSQALQRVFKMVGKRAGVDDTLPDVFHRPILRVGDDLQKMFATKFSSTDLRTIIIASRVLYGPEQIGSKRKGNKYFKEVYFTDADTAKYLVGLQAGAAKFDPSSYVASEIEITTDADLGLAVRASISDPYYINPITIQGSYFLTGAVNLYPYEVAEKLGDEMIAPYVGSFDSLEQNAFGSVYGFNSNKRLQLYHARTEGVRWVDFSDAGDTIYQTSGFNPKPDIKSLAIKSRIPAEYEEYKRKVGELWAFGYARGLEAFGRAKGDQSHIRTRNCENTAPCPQRPDIDPYTRGGP